MKTLTLWTFGLLCISLSEVHGLNSFPDNLVVAQRNVPVTLTCDRTTGENVTWKLNGEELDVSSEYHFRQVGPNLTVLEVDGPTVGEYSCWRGDEMLSSTYVLLEAEEKTDLDSFLTCWAKSYDCVFSCNWTNRNFKLVRLGLGQNCNEGGESCLWVSGKLSDGAVQFEVPHSLSPYAEESNMLELIVEAISDTYVFRRTKEFYLRDIVVPESPQIVKCHKVDQNLMVTIEPPLSWSTPSSFFSLEHEIQYVLQDNGQDGSSFSGLIPMKVGRLRARSRDPLVHSDWSQWTDWKNVTTGKKNPGKCKSTAKSCFQELIRCKKRRKNNGKRGVKKIEASKKRNV